MIRPTHAKSDIRLPFSRAACFVVFISISICPNHRSLAADGIEMGTPTAATKQLAEGFTQPYRSVDIAACEMGVLAEILVREGELVSAKQTLAKLDDRVLAESLEVSRLSKDATGALRAAISERDSRSRQFNILRELREKNNATDQETQRAKLMLAIAEAKLQSVREDLSIRRAEYERTKVQIQRRQLVSPLDGIVIDIRKDVGEFVSPTEPTVLTVIQLSQLKVVFSVHRSWTKNLRTGQRVNLRVAEPSLAEKALIVPGTIDFVSPQVDPKSGTTTVKIRIENNDQTIPCGVICRWDGNTSGAAALRGGQSARRPRSPHTMTTKRR